MNLIICNTLAALKVTKPLIFHTVTELVCFQGQIDILFQIGENVVLRIIDCLALYKTIISVGT